MRSCYYNGELKYITNLNDFKECMEYSVYEILEKVIQDIIKRERDDERRILLNS